MPAPKFMIAIQEIEVTAQGRAYPEPRDFSNWIPPRIFGGNGLKNTNDQRYFTCDGERIRPWDSERDPRRMIEDVHGIASLYHKGGTIYVTYTDATTNQVGEPQNPKARSRPGQSSFANGGSHQTAGNPNRRNFDWCDWAEMKFDYSNVVENGSFACGTSFNEKIRAEHERERVDGSCLRKYFPEKYHSEQDHLVRQGEGGAVVGYLPLLVGLFALTIPEMRLAEAFRDHFYNGMFHKQDLQPYRADQRGFLVKIYYYYQHSRDPDASKAARDQNEREIRWYERGGMGKIFAHG